RGEDRDDVAAILAEHGDSDVEPERRPRGLQDQGEEVNRAERRVGTALDAAVRSIHASRDYTGPAMAARNLCRPVFRSRCRCRCCAWCDPARTAALSYLRPGPPGVRRPT